MKSSKGSRVKKLEEFYIRKGKIDIVTDEIFTEIRFPKPSRKYAIAFEKLGLCDALAISRISAAVYLTCNASGIIDNVRISSGSIKLASDRIAKEGNI